MVLNKKGQTAILGIMIGVFVFLLAMTFIDPLSDVITESRAADQLDCDNSSISDGKKLTCLMVDLILPYFIGVVIAVAGGYLGARILT